LIPPQAPPLFFVVKKSQSPLISSGVVGVSLRYEVLEKRDDPAFHPLTLIQFPLPCCCTFPFPSHVPTLEPFRFGDDWPLPGKAQKIGLSPDSLPESGCFFSGALRLLSRF